MFSICLYKIKSFFFTRNNPNNWHEDFIVHLAKVLKPNVYVELGLYRCDIFNRIIPYSNTLIGVDLSPDSGKYMKKSKKTSFQNMTTDHYYEILKKE